MIHSHRAKDDPERRARALSRILDPEYTGQSGNGQKARSPSLPRASVFVDRYGEQHDPDFRPFGSYPAVTPMEEPSAAWPWLDDDEDGPRTISKPRGYSATSSSYHSSIVSSGSGSTSSGYGSRSMSSALLTPPLEPESPMIRNLSPPAHIPRSALFPWTPAQRAVRAHHETRRNVIPPPFLEEEPEIPLTLVDSRYVPGYGHFSTPQPPRPATIPDEESKRTGRARAHTAPSPTTQSPDDTSISPSHHTFRQSVYSFGLRTKLGLHHMKDRIRRASGAAKRPLSL
ncbi:unnamed protein product [Rhizoctonia solani]|uniref:Uncharacterized protein n=1 Tax=Rhizoctonia solani TaxID=456999 RepID=A0A8H3E9K6_9AGAM|nr:unnamed protein product [Rhizoctonia solani]